jgi:hypothetical protein
LQESLVFGFTALHTVAPDTFKKFVAVAIPDDIAFVGQFGDQRL